MEAAFLFLLSLRSNGFSTLHTCPHIVLSVLLAELTAVPAACLYARSCTGASAAARATTTFEHSHDCQIVRRTPSA